MGWENAQFRLGSIVRYGGKSEQFPGGPTSVARHYGRDWRIKVKGPDAVEEKAESSSSYDDDESSSSTSSRQLCSQKGCVRPRRRTGTNEAGRHRLLLGNACRLVEPGRAPVSVGVDPRAACILIDEGLVILIDK